MEVEFKVKNIQEWEKLCDENDIDISTTIINSILKNLKKRKRFVYILSVHLEDTDEIFDISLDRKNFLETLKENLVTQENNDRFETCQEILVAIKFLEKS